jgi:beta-glucosidase
VKFELGLFESPYVDVDRAVAANGNAFHRSLAREAARQSLVLLKNDASTLPLGNRLKSIAVIGVDADRGPGEPTFLRARRQTGSWSHW